MPSILTRVSLNAGPGSPGRVLVAVCTFRRSAELTALLDSMEPALSGRDADLLVVDNDPAGSAEAAVRQHRTGARYVLCPEPGIAQARNAAMKHRGGYRAIAFVDDDETVAPDWFDELVAGADSYSADVATGPVVSLFPPATPEWVVRGGFLQRSRRSSGSPVEYAATNNILLQNDALDRLEHPWFDTSFSRSGGSDAELCWRLARVGASIIWIDAAVVSEVVPLERLTARWIVRRIVRGGNVGGRLLLRDLPRRTVIVRGLREVALGTLQITRSALLRRGAQANEVGALAHGVGLLRAGAGLTIREYERG